MLLELKYMRGLAQRTNVASGLQSNSRPVKIGDYFCSGWTIFRQLKEGKGYIRRVVIVVSQSVSDVLFVLCIQVQI